MWKLAAVQDGRAAEGLLDTYRAEREAVGRRAVAEAQAAWEVTRIPSAIPFAGRSLRQIDMGYRYASAAVIDDGSPDADGPGDYVPLADPGCRAPHLWLDGGARSTLDLFGRDFVLLTAPEGEPWRAGVPGGGVGALCVGAGVARAVGRQGGRGRAGASRRARGVAQPGVGAGPGRRADRRAGGGAGVWGVTDPEVAPSRCYSCQLASSASFSEIRSWKLLCRSASSMSATTWLSG